MKLLTQRCRQCGWVHEAEAERLPCHGVRVRCEECGSWLPLLTSPAGAAEGWAGSRRGEEQRIADRARPRFSGLDEVRGAGGCAGAGPSASAARELLRPWLREIARTDLSPLSAESLFGDHGDDVRRLYALWEAAYPGREAAEALHEALRAELEAAREKGALPA